MIWLLQHLVCRSQIFSKSVCGGLVIGCKLAGWFQAASTNIVKLMARAMYRIPNMSMGRCAFYMNRTVHSGMALAAMDRSQYVLKINEGLTQFGQPHSWLSFLGVPLRKVDALLNTEAVVTA